MSEQGDEPTNPRWVDWFLMSSGAILVLMLIYGLNNW